MREDPERPGLGEDQYIAVKNGDEVPEADVELSDDDPPVVKLMKELIIKMTSHKARDRPSAKNVVSFLSELHAQVNSPKPDGDVYDSSLQVMQALNDWSLDKIDAGIAKFFKAALKNNDKRKAPIDEDITSQDVPDWMQALAVINRLVSKPVNVSIFGTTTCLTMASYFNDALTLRQLVEEGCDVTARDSRGRTPLHVACESHIDANNKVVFLLQCDASLVNATDYFNSTPIHLAVCKGNSDVVKTLLHYGADANARGRIGKKALHYACEQGHVACIHELMAGGAEIEAKDSEREATPLHLAAYCNHPDSVKTLVDVYKATINATDKFDRTALHHAAGYGFIDVVQVLVSNPQCDVTVRERESLTALHLAAYCG